LASRAYQQAPLAERAERGAHLHLDVVVAERAQTVKVLFAKAALNARGQALLVWFAPRCAGERTRHWKHTNFFRKRPNGLPHLSAAAAAVSLV
jgi:hypothetical protein